MAVPICLSRYQPVKKIGSGTFGQVYLATQEGTEDKFVLKRIRCPDPYHTKMALRECKLSQELQCPALVKVYDSWCEKSDAGRILAVWIAMAYAEGGDLFDKVIKSSDRFVGLPELEAAPIFEQVLLALHFLHFHGYVHCDLKMENVVLSCKTDKFPRAFLIDLGLTDDEKNLTRPRGSLRCSAPEQLLQQRPNTFASDIWSLGVLLYEMITGSSPFEISAEVLRDTKLGATKRDLATEFKHVVFPQEVWMTEEKKAVPLSAQLKDCVLKMLSFDPAERPSTYDLLRHPWLVEMRQLKSKEKNVALNKAEARPLTPAPTSPSTFQELLLPRRSASYPVAKKCLTQAMKKSKSGDERHGQWIAA